MSVSVVEWPDEPTPIAPPECPVCGHLPRLRLGSLAQRPLTVADAWRIGACVASYTSTRPGDGSLIWQWCHVRGLLYVEGKVYDCDRRREAVPVPLERRRARRK